MRRLASLFAIFLLSLTAAPLLACMTESAKSPQENACCRAMHRQCGGMETMGCCRTKLRTDEHPQLAASAASIHLSLTAIYSPGPSVFGAQTNPRIVSATTTAHSPPGLILARSTVLRI